MARQRRSEGEMGAEAEHNLIALLKHLCGYCLSKQPYGLCAARHLKPTPAQGQESGKLNLASDKSVNPFKRFAFATPMHCALMQFPAIFTLNGRTNWIRHKLRQRQAQPTPAELSTPSSQMTPLNCGLSFGTQKQFKFQIHWWRHATLEQTHTQTHAHTA